MKRFSQMVAVFLLSSVCSAKEVVNVYAYTGEVPDFIVRRFETETGIKVNISSYENNEIMYSKLRATPHPGYDVIMPSSYFVDRMRRQDLLQPLDKTQLPNFKQLNTQFTNPDYDPNCQFSVPHIWGITGIFYNRQYYQDNEVASWADLWKKQFYNQLLVLDDTREVFSMALLSLGFSPNDNDKEHIKAAFEKLKLLMPNVKVFSTDTVAAIITDEDATVGMAWNGDTYKAFRDNPKVQFVFPKEGFVIWVDTFAIPKSAPHQANAYRFINYLLEPEVARDIALSIGYPTANQGGQALLPAAVRNNPMIYPTKAVLAHGQFQRDLGDSTLALYEKYWEELKMAG